MSEGLGAGEEGLGLKPGLVDLKLEPGVHREGELENSLETAHSAAR